MKFSVLMPVYYKENPVFLDSSLKSILVDQSLIPNEVLIVEDGPLTPELYFVLEKYFNQFNQIIKRIVLSQNMGMGYAMNIGLQNCKYEWIARMDSDDIAVRNRFETQINFLVQNSEYSVIGGAIEEFHNQIGDIEYFRTLPSNHSEIVKMMKYRNPINHMTVIFNKRIAIEAGGYWSERYFEDYNLWYEMFKIGAVFVNMDFVLVHARIGNNMVSRRSGYDYFKYEKLLLKKFLKEGFIDNVEYIILTFSKLLLRISPLIVLKIVYKFFLRYSKL